MNCAVDASTLKPKVMDFPYIDHVLCLKLAQIAQIYFPDSCWCDLSLPIDNSVVAIAGENKAHL